MNSMYLMENDEEVIRLESKTDGNVVCRQALKAGLLPGMRVADICCGTGLTTSFLSNLTGPEGWAIGIDVSKERIAHARSHYENSTTGFACRDIREDLADLGKFDFIWVRFILEYFRDEAQDIVRNLSSILSENGILCLIDLDHNCLNHYNINGKLEKAIQTAIKYLEEHENFDPYAGRKLYSHLYRAGFHDIEVDLAAHHLIYGELKETDEFNWLKKIEVVSQKIGLTLPGYEAIADFLTDFHAFFSSPERFTYTPLISCWGKWGDFRR
jgi:ubiquinone/menaquinone biosynthesis C-methylase UbiE